MSALIRALKFLKPYTRDAVLAMVLLALVVGVDLSIPRFVQVIIDQGVASKNMSVIFQTSLIMIGASILSALLSLANTVFSVRASQRFAADVREAVYHKIQSFSFGNLDAFPTGRLLVRLTSDVNQLQMVVMLALRMLVRAPLLLIGSIAFMIATNQQLALTMLLLLPLTLILIIIFIRIAQPLFLAIQKKLETNDAGDEPQHRGCRLLWWASSDRRQPHGRRNHGVHQLPSVHHVSLTHALDDGWSDLCCQRLCRKGDGDR
jgi:ATP-binding cassette subfamily B protein